MANKDLWLKPHNMKSNWWWYETPKGISICVPCECGVTHIKELPWRSIRSALNRKDKTPTARTAKATGACQLDPDKLKGD